MASPVAEWIAEQACLICYNLAFSLFKGSDFPKALRVTISKLTSYVFTKQPVSFEQSSIWYILAIYQQRGPYNTEIHMQLKNE
jgi:hypothetical protein